MHYRQFIRFIVEDGTAHGSTTRPIEMKEKCKSCECADRRPNRKERRRIYLLSIVAKRVNDYVSNNRKRLQRFTVHFDIFQHLNAISISLVKIPIRCHCKSAPKIERWIAIRGLLYVGIFLSISKRVINVVL